MRETWRCPECKHYRMTYPNEGKLYPHKCFKCGYIEEWLTREEFLVANERAGYVGTD